MDVKNIKQRINNLSTRFGKITSKGEKNEYENSYNFVSNSRNRNNYTKIGKNSNMKQQNFYTSLFRCI